MSEGVFPSGNNKIGSTAELGRVVKAKRREDGLTQMEAAALCGVGTRFLSDLENGKPTVELGKTLQVMKGLGLECVVVERGWRHIVKSC